MIRKISATACPHTHASLQGPVGRCPRRTTTSHPCPSPLDWLCPSNTRGSQLRAFAPHVPLPEPSPRVPLGWLPLITRVSAHTLSVAEALFLQTDALNTNDTSHSPVQAVQSPGQGRAGQGMVGLWPAHQGRNE